MKKKEKKKSSKKADKWRKNGEKASINIKIST